MYRKKEIQKERKSPFLRMLVSPRHMCLEMKTHTAPTDSKETDQ